MTRRRQRQIPPAEWIAGVISAGIIVGTIGFLLFEAIQPGAEGPSLFVQVVQVRHRGSSFAVDVVVRNDSGSAAADVHLAGTPSSNSDDIEARARIDYVPGFSTRRATLVFDSDPGSEPVVRIVGYSQP